MDDDWEELPQRETAWQARDRVTAYRKRLLAAGYWPLPCNGKAPTIEEWSSCKATNAIIGSWQDTRPDSINSGILTFNTPTIDNDVLDEEVAEEVEVLAEDIVGKTAVRIGQSPKRALLYRTNDPFPKLTTGLFASPSGHTHKVEILCDGQQVIVDGIHPDTKQPYRWHSGEPGPNLKREDLPLLTAQKAAEFMDAVKELMRNRGWKPVEEEKKKPNGKKTSTNGRTEDASIRERAYAQAALDGCAEEMAAAPKHTRNETLNKKAFRLGTMVARGWIPRSEVEDALFDAVVRCGLVADKAEKAARATIKSGLDAGEEKPHPPLDSDETKEEWEEPESKNDRFKLTRLGEIAPSLACQYIVKDILPRAGLVVVWGPPKCGKSFWTLDLALHVALCQQYREWRTKGGPVVYLALEGQAGFDARIEAFKRAHAWAQDGPFFLVKARINLVKDHPALIACIRAQSGEDQPAMVVIDTLNRSLVGSESKDEDMSAYLNAAEAIRDAFGCTVIIVHHCGVDGTRPRGHTSLTGAVDAQIAVSRDAQQNIIVEVEYMKDGKEGTVIASRLDRVEIGTDEDGDLISTCIIAPVEGVDPPKAKKNTKSLTKTGKVVLRALHEAIAELGAVPPASNYIPSGVKVVTVDQWREYAYRRSISSGEDRARQQAFKRATDALIADKHVMVWTGQVWPTTGE